MFPYGQVVPAYTPQNIGPFTLGITSGAGGVTVTVSTRTIVLLTRTVSYRVTYTVSVRTVVTTSPFEMLIRWSDGRRSRLVSCDCAADSLVTSVSAAARPSAQVVILRTRILITPPGALHAATLVSRDRKSTRLNSSHRVISY